MAWLQYLGWSHRCLAAFLCVLGSPEQAQTSYSAFWGQATHHTPASSSVYASCMQDACCLTSIIDDATALEWYIPSCGATCHSIFSVPSAYLADLHVVLYGHTCPFRAAVIQAWSPPGRHFVALLFSPVPHRFMQRPYILSLPLLHVPSNC